MAQPAFLETFRTSDATLKEQPLVSTEAWQAGFEAGYEKALQDTKEEQDQLSAQVVQHLNDMAFGYHEARTHLEDALRPLFDQLVGVFLPRMAKEALIPLVAQELQLMARGLMDAPVRLCVSPGTEPAFRSAMSELVDFPLEVRADDSLGDHAVILTGAGEESAIDLRPLLHEIGSILGTITTQQTEHTDHG
jgi:flagellar assembly protein FliH